MLCLTCSQILLSPIAFTTSSSGLSRPFDCSAVQVIGWPCDNSGGDPAASDAMIFPSRSVQASPSASILMPGFFASKRRPMLLNAGPREPIAAARGHAFHHRHGDAIHAYLALCRPQRAGAAAGKSRRGQALAAARRPVPFDDDAVRHLLPCGLFPNALRARDSRPGDLQIRKLAPAILVTGFRGGPKPDANSRRSLLRLARPRQHPSSHLWLTRPAVAPQIAWQDRKAAG